MKNAYIILGNGPAAQRTLLNNSKGQNQARVGSLHRYWIEKVSYRSPKQTIDQNQEQQEQYPPPSYESALRRMDDEQQQLYFRLPIESTLPGTPVYAPAEEEGAVISQQVVDAVATSVAPTVLE